MAKEHKYHHSHIEIDTALTLESVLQLARRVADARRTIELVEQDHNVLTFVSKGVLGDKLLTFTFTATTQGDRTHAVTELLRYTTSQEKLYYLIPISPRIIEGYGEYRRFMNGLQEVIAAADPGARCSIVERVAVA